MISNCVLLQVRMFPTQSNHLFVLALACLISFDQSLCCVPKIELKGKSYMLDAFIQFTTTSIYQIQEIHSAWQARSKLHFEWYRRDELDQRESTRIAIYADKERLLRVKLKDPPTCKQIDRDYVDALFNRNTLKGFDSGHLIGAARLLTFVEANHDRFLQIEPSVEQEETLSHKLLYEAKFEPGVGGVGFKITLFYHEDETQNLANEIPRMIEIETNAGLIASYTINQYLELKEDRVQGSVSSLETSYQYQYSNVAGSEVTLDMFAIDRNFGCSKAIAKELDIKDPKLETKQFRFSFQARPVIQPTNDEPLEITVVYEPSLANLRVDRSYKSKSMTKIIDFQDNHQYQIMRKKSLPATSHRGPLLDQIFTVEPEEHTCVVSRASTLSSLGNPYSLGQMLLGTSNLAYLGLARVRGIEARVYEQHDCDWPIWLHQQSIYTDASDKRNKLIIPKLRNDVEVARKYGISMINVFYFTKTGSQDFDGGKGYDDVTQAKLLLIEILFKDDKTGRILRRVSYSIFDFEWSLPSSSPAGGGRYEGLFSLQNDCLADVDNGEYGTINLSFEAKIGAENLGWLQDRTKRNLALLQMLQLQLFISPISMLYDFESRLTTTTGVLTTTTTTTTNVPGSHELLHPVSLKITAKMVRRYGKVAGLLYLGLINVNRDLVNTFNSISFQVCHTLAAHQRADTLFAYRANTFECSLIKPEIFSAYDGDVSRLMKVLSLPGRDPTLQVDELYQIQHRDHAQAGIDRLKAIGIDLKRSDNVLISDPAKLVVKTSQATSEATIKLDIKSAHVTRLDDKARYDLTDGKTHISDTNKFIGLGLVAYDNQNKLVELKDADDDQNDEISFEHCHTACLADLECRSFSVCHRHGKTSCVMSEVSFATPSMAQQLGPLIEKEETKPGEMFSIAVDLEEQNHLETGAGKGNSSSKAVSIQLMKHPACELHNKLYRNLFKMYPFWLSRLTRSVVYPVAHVEQCSQICFLKTLVFLRDEMNQFSSDLLASPSSQAKLDQAWTKSCDRFHYVDQETINLLTPERADLFKKRLDNSVSVEKFSGYCVLDDNSSHNDPESSSLSEDDLKFGQVESQRYEFDYLNLYSKQYGVSLVESPLSEKERRALWERKLNPKDVADIKSYKENYGKQVTFSQNYGEHSSDCAQECFWPQFRAAYPSCRSFDSFVVSNPQKTTRRICGFNSMTLESATAANRTDLIRIGSDKQERVSVGRMDSVIVWHYELRPGLVADSVATMYRIQLAEDIRAAAATRPPQVHTSGFKLFCGSVIMLSLGIALGITFGHRLIVTTSQAVHSDTNRLVEERICVPDLAKLEPRLSLEKIYGEPETATY